ncbi:hypothetical protein FQA39_LY01617 [Lamprigera yunnana]|nr:hypothetical protein FQA39_LY01617 [Lamprigera yunnana]
MSSQVKKDSKNVPMEPQERLRYITNYSSSVDIDPGIPPRRYFRSGLEMVRMAEVYLSEGSLENAYVLYMKFMTLFLEKIRKHPEYGSVPGPEKHNIQMQLREVLPKTEKLKIALLEQFTKEYNHYLIEIKRQQAEAKQKELEKPKPTNTPVNITSDLWNQAHLAYEHSISQINSINFPEPSAPSLPSVPDNTAELYLDDFSQGFSQHPSINRATKPSTSLVEKHGLRTVVTPAKVISHFLNLSQKNTFNNIETCGILAGKLEKNHLIITHVILPKQRGTSDSCITMNEEEIFDYQDQHNLITIGWIHTHPTQTAFLSSVDLHTHCPYQLLMPEAIAIVCAPKYEQTGFFILTPHYGLSFIASCKKSGFHPHPTEPPLFMNAEHVTVDGNAPLKVLDLR